LAPTRSYFHPVLRCCGWAGRCCRRFGGLGRFRTRWWDNHLDHAHDAHSNNAKFHPVVHELQLYKEDLLIDGVSRPR